MKDATAQATTAWVAMCHDHARRHGYGLILEGTFKDPQELLDIAATYAAQGYQVEMTALAVRLERSSLDALNRHLPAHDTAPGRWVYPDRAQNAYRMIPLTVAAAEDAPQIHRIKVTNRTGEDLYTNVRTAEGSWQHEPAGAATVEAERARPLPGAEAAEWLHLCHQVALNFTAADHLNDTTLDALNRVLSDAHRVGPMAAWTVTRPGTWRWKSSSPPWRPRLRGTSTPAAACSLPFADWTRTPPARSPSRYSASRAMWPPAYTRARTG